MGAEIKLTAGSELVATRAMGDVVFRSEVLRKMIRDSTVGISDPIKVSALVPKRARKVVSHCETDARASTSWVTMSAKPSHVTLSPTMFSTRARSALEVDVESW